jgi:tRNA 2-thiocytidine biosynthesis protein TtcA
MFYGGKLKAMPPKLVSDDGRHTVIRPLAYVAEADLAAYAQDKAFPIIPCNLCGSQENLKRKEVGRMIQEWDRKYPGRAWNVFNALANVVPTHLMDRQLFDFVGLRPNGVADANGDTAFDQEAPETTEQGCAGSSMADGDAGDGDERTLSFVRFE